ncbi:myeloid-associated differentiation marker-like [Microtus ochrogaster]|uniref:Myeloid-associated differentiation marker n=1 Tax=Microtus ochrogaster TaxID=79684 RepID=A0A8J6GST8_MICOH|nr:myeloid-associated differentiation marker-like [Microtus ochrogaster]KAH0516208.1 Myeloid-associated differentiation marker [Microtus ochrogaster]
MSVSPVTVTHTTIKTSASPGLESLTIVGSPRILIRPLGLLRLLELSSTCLAFSLVAHGGAWIGSTGNWCMFSWCFCFSMTLMILSLELGGFQRCCPLTWLNFPNICASYAFFFCLSSSIIYPLTYMQFLDDGYVRERAVSATIFSCISCVAYATEVTWTRARPGQTTVYMATVSGRLKVFESFVACVIFLLISNPSLYNNKPALEWCVAVYAICFILTVVIIIVKVGNYTNIVPFNFASFLTSMAFLSVLFYTTAVVLWPLFQFNKVFQGQPHRTMDVTCQYKAPHSVCAWDRRLAVAVMTGVNLLAYMVDFKYSI